MMSLKVLTCSRCINLCEVRQVFGVEPVEEHGEAGLVGEGEDETSEIAAQSDRLQLHPVVSGVLEGVGD